MKLPRGEDAVVDTDKLKDYCLSVDHPRGKHKARVFAAALGITADHVDALRAALLEAARSEETTPMDRDEFGQRYVVDFVMHGPKGTAPVRSSWIIRTGEESPRLTSCYVK